MNALKTLFFSTVSTVLIGSASCSMPDMKVSEGMQQDATAMPVVGRPAVRVSFGKEKGFGFGTYKLEGIRRGWTSRTQRGSLILVSDAYQKYSFGVRDTVQQKNWFVQAAAMLHAITRETKGWSINLDNKRELLHVGFHSPESGDWTLSLVDPDSYLDRVNFAGRLSNGTEEIEILPLYKWQGKTLPSGTPLGYEFSRGGHVLASVQTLKNEKVWMKNTLSPDLQMVLATACSSLLLYNQLGEDL